MGGCISNKSTKNNKKIMGAVDEQKNSKNPYYSRRKPVDITADDIQMSRTIDYTTPNKERIEEVGKVIKKYLGVDLEQLISE
mmetsp:Transcript_12141/g.10768  ORF Transcript_12141/g.10768 Transcript_12141/m.10768 type:complete len:82 (+) Transcript_12141:36-281(+)